MLRFGPQKTSTIASSFMQITTTFQTIVGCPCQAPVWVGAGIGDTSLSEPQDRVQQHVGAEAKMRIVGPNCFGLCNNLTRAGVLFIPRFDTQPYHLGPIGIASQSGALGYVLKDAPVEELVEAIQTVYAGQAYFSSDIARVALTQFVRGSSEGPSPMNLTNREREVLIFIAEGLSNKEIAVKLNLGVRTVETHRERIMRKLNIHSIAGLTRFAIAKGMISIQGIEN